MTAGIKLAAIVLVLSPSLGRADPPENWVFKWNRLLQGAVTDPTAQLEQVAEALEKQDYARLANLAASKVYDKDLSTWRALPLEREVIYGWILKLRIDQFNDLYYWQKKRGTDLEVARENVGIAYRRLARCENLHLWSRLAVIRAQEISEGSTNIGWRSPTRQGLDQKWTFYVGADNIGTLLNDYENLYVHQVRYRKPSFLTVMWGVFTLRVLFVVSADEDREVDLVKRHFYLEIDDASGKPLKLPELEEMAAKERERIKREVEAE